MSLVVNKSELNGACVDQ